MKIAPIFIAAILAGCASKFANGPKTYDMLVECRAKTERLQGMHKCFSDTLTKYYPGWDEAREAYEIRTLVSHVRSIEREVANVQETDYTGWRRILEINNRMTAQIKSEQAQASYASQQRTNAALAGAAILLTAPAYQPAPIQAPLIPYPSDVNINVQTSQPYRFYDSRPYR